jgi:hypothetical protein
MKTALLLACALLMTFASCHDLTHSQERLVMGVEWYNWFTDGFVLLIWTVAAIVIFPVGWIATLIGFPGVYTSMYDSMVTGLFHLAAM